jgi:hypothetical protein
MGWLSDTFDKVGDIAGDVLGTAGDAFGGIVGGYLGTATGEAIYPSESSFSRSDVRQGHAEDRRDYKKRDRYDWRQAKKRGLTPQEFYGSPAAGGSATSGGASVLGNSADKASILAKQQGGEAAQRALDRKTSLEQTRMTTEAQKAVAEISANAQLGSAGVSAEASKYAADIQKKIADGKLNLATREFEEYVLPLAALNLDKTKEEIKKVINEVATSTPEFQRSMKLLSMGVDNTIQTALLQRYGVDITSKKDMARLSTQQFKNILGTLMAAGSHMNRELQGLFQVGDSVLGTMNDPSSVNRNVDPVKPNVKAGANAAGLIR